MLIPLNVEYEKLKDFVQICWDVGFTHCGVDSIDFYIGHSNLFGLNTSNPYDQLAVFPHPKHVKDEDRRSDRPIPLGPNFDRVSGGCMYTVFRDVTSTLDPIIHPSVNGAARQYCGNYKWLLWDLNKRTLETKINVAFKPKATSFHKSQHEDDLFIHRRSDISHLPICYNCDGSGFEIEQFQDFECEFLCKVCYGRRRCDWIDRALNKEI